jgi:hypothetical protein
MSKRKLSVALIDPSRPRAAIIEEGRDRPVSGEGNGIDGAHILTPMPYLISTIAR